MLVANLPYNVSVPVLLHFLETSRTSQRGVVMVQAEVGERLAAPPGLQGLRRAERQGRLVRPVAPRRHRVAARCSGRSRTSTASWSASSATASRAAPRTERRARSRIVDAAFQQRRKMLRQALSRFSAGRRPRHPQCSERADVAPTARGEELSIDDFVRIARERA